MATRKRTGPLPSAQPATPQAAPPTSPEPEAVAAALAATPIPDENSPPADAEVGEDVEDIMYEDDDDILTDPEDGFDDGVAAARSTEAERPTDATADMIEQSASDERIAMSLERMSRDEESREAADYLEAPGLTGQVEFNLEAPPPRPGQDQRWIAAMVMGKDEPGNLAQSYRRGWKPRDPSTVTNRNFPTYEGANGKGFIGQAGLVLMERPIEITEHRRKKVAAITANRSSDAARKVLDRAAGSGHEISVNHRSSTTQGRNAAPQFAED